MLVSRAAHVMDGGRRYETKPSRGVLMSFAIFAEIVKRQRTKTAKRDDFISISWLAACTLVHYYSATYAGLRERDSLFEGNLWINIRKDVKCDISCRRQRLTMFFHGKQRSGVSMDARRGHCMFRVLRRFRRDVKRKRERDSDGSIGRSRRKVRDEERYEIK